MEKIEIVRTGKIRDVYAIFIDGKRVRQKDLTVEIDEDYFKNKSQQKFKLSGWFNEDSAAKESLLKLNFSDLIRLDLAELNFYKLGLLRIKDFPRNREYINWQGPVIYFGKRNGKNLNGNFVFIADILPESYIDFPSWDKRYSWSQYRREFIKQIKGYSENFLITRDIKTRNYLRKFDLIIMIENLEERVGDFFERNKKILAKIHSKTIETIEQKLLKDAVKRN